MVISPIPKNKPAIIPRMGIILLNIPLYRSAMDKMNIPPIKLVRPAEDVIKYMIIPVNCCVMTMTGQMK